MPVYQYQCKKCGYVVEKHQSFSDEPLKTCPNCGEDELRKKFGNVSVAFKGSGFYSTDKSAGSDS